MELVMSGNYTSASIIRFAGDARNGAQAASFTGEDMDVLINNELVWVEIYEDTTTQYIKVAPAK